MPARAAYAAAAADVFPVEAQITEVEPASTARETARVMPLSLNEQVGFSPSYLRNRDMPVWIFAANRGAGISGVFPSSNVTMCLVVLEIIKVGIFPDDAIPHCHSPVRTQRSLTQQDQDSSNSVPKKLKFIIYAEVAFREGNCGNNIFAKSFPRMFLPPHYKRFQNLLAWTRHWGFTYDIIVADGDNDSRSWEFLGRGPGRPFLQKGPPRKLFQKVLGFETISSPGSHPRS